MMRWFALCAMSCFMILGLVSCTQRDPAAASPASDSAASLAAFPDEWFFHGPKRSSVLRGLEGKPAAELKVKDWIGEPQALANLKGQIVVIDFWATWCPPCMKSLPQNIAVANRYKDRGVVFIGVHDANRGHDKMPMVAKNLKINYPLAVDDNGASTKAYKIQFWPSYYIIDGRGIIRGAGLEPGSIEKAIDRLLAEN